MFPDRSTPSRCRSAGLAVGGVAGSLRGLWLRARERCCSWRLRASTYSMRDERCCVHGEVCAPRYVLFLVAPRARILAGGLICCSIWVIHALLDLKVVLRFPSARLRLLWMKQAAVSFIFVLCRALLADCVLSAGRQSCSADCNRHRHGQTNYPCE